MEEIDKTSMYIQKQLFIIYLFHVSAQEHMW